MYVNLYVFYISIHTLFIQAKLRDLKTSGEQEAPIYLKTDMSTGHFSASDRYKYVRETAFEYSYLLDQISDKSEVAEDKY